MVQSLGAAGPLQVVSGAWAVGVALVTQLGDLWFLFALVAFAYWADRGAPWVGRGLDRERAALVVAVLVGVVALLQLLKPLFAVARPPGFDVAPTADVPTLVRPAYEWMATADGYGFPSGHALAATAVWGALAWSVRAGRRRTRLALTATVVAAVAASRVLLGVHYVGDVLAGAALGLGYLLVVLRWIRDPGRAFALAAGVAALALALVGVSTDGAATLGLAVGLTATWYGLGEVVVATPATRPGAAATTVLGVLTAAPLLVAAVSLDAPAWLVAVVAALGGASLLGLPVLGERLGPALASEGGGSATGQ